MKRIIKVLSITLILVVVFACGVFSKSTLESIQAYLNYGITVSYNGHPQVMQDANGNRVYPITYQGTTYVPIRAVSNMLGVNVDWDNNSQTVLLGESDKSISLIDDIEAFVSERYSSIKTTDYTPCTIGSRSYNAYARFYYSFGIGGNSYACYDLQGKYDKLTFSAYTKDHGTCMVRVFGDNDVLLGEFAVLENELPQTFSCNISNTVRLKIECPGVTILEPCVK